jgi:hypothetical protein
VRAPPSQTRLSWSASKSQRLRRGILLTILTWQNAPQTVRRGAYGEPPVGPPTSIRTDSQPSKPTGQAS